MLFRKFMNLMRAKKYAREDERRKNKELEAFMKKWDIHY